MIITCASCLTKFNLDDSKIPAQGTKVRCSRCKHVFMVVPSPRAAAEVGEDFESFAKEHEDLLEPGGGREEPSVSRREKESNLRPPREEEEEIAVPTEGEEEIEPFSIPEAPAEKPTARRQPSGFKDEEKPSGRQLRMGKRATREKKGPSLFFALLVVLIVLVFGAFYLWTELQSGGSLSRYVASPMKKVSDLWEQIWKTEREGLIVRDMDGYEEKFGEIPIYILEGKVYNQSGSSRKYVSLKVMLFDQNRNQIAQRETICGRTMTREELKAVPSTFFKGDMVLKPQSERETVCRSGQAVPFWVAFKDLPRQATGFKVEILRAPRQ